MQPAVATQLDFYFDVLCPFTWRTSLWIRHVARERPLTVAWRHFSLAIGNRADPIPMGEDALAVG